MLYKIIVIHTILLFIRVLYVIYRDIDLSTEEAQYWLWSKHLDLSYYSKPPLIAYLNYISTTILGDTEIGVRINSIVLGFLIAIITYLFSKYLFKDERLALFISLFIYLIPAYNIASIIFLTDTPLAFFYLLLSYLFYKSVQENKPVLWVLTGMSAGFAFLSKYSAVFFFPVVLVYIFFYRREIFKEKWFYISILIATIFTLPVIYWNIANDFVSFKHVGKLAGANESTLNISLKHFGDYVLGQIGLNSVFFFPLMVYGIFKAFKEKDEKLIYLALSPIIVFLFFGIIALFKNVEANWPAFGYSTLYILTGYLVYERFLKKSITLMFLSGLTVLLLFYTPILDKLGLTNLLPPEKDPTKRLVEWESLGNYVKTISDKYPKNFIFSDSYHISSELAFYVRPFRQTYCVRVDRRMNQFDLWEGINKFENKGYYGIYVADHQITDKVKSGFEELVFQTEYEVKYRKKKVKTYYIYVLKNYKRIEEDPILSY